MYPHPERARRWRRGGGLWQAVACTTFVSILATAHVALADPLGGGPLHVSKQLPLTPSDHNITWIGSVTSQGDAVMGGPLARSGFGVDGTGVKVGIISDSFNLFGGQPLGIATGNLPGTGNPNGFTTAVNVLQEGVGAGNLDEGRAIAELVHDVAPGAQIMFHTAFNNPETTPSGSIAVAINNLVSAGADVIVDDVFDLRSPAYQDGAAAQAVDAAYAAGVAYFSSAGNNANNAYESIYAPIFATNHNFDANANEGGSNLLGIGNIPNGGQVTAALWWDDAYASQGGTPTTDYHLGIYNVTDGVVEGGSAQNQLAGADPWEAFVFTNTDGATKSYALFVEHAGGDPDKQLKIQVLGRTIQDDDDTDSPTTSGHNSAAGAMAVGAAAFYSPNNAEPYTAHGPTTILRDPAGNPLPLIEIRNAPFITGIDGGNTSFFFSDSVNDADTFPNFFGTSASAPHVAAIAALMLEKAAAVGHDLSPAEIYDVLRISTIDIGAPGYDNITGFGRLDAFAALAATVPEPKSLALLFVGLAMLVRRGVRCGRNR